MDITFPTRTHNLLKLRLACFSLEKILDVSTDTPAVFSSSKIMGSCTECAFEVKFLFFEAESLNKFCGLVGD